MLKTLGEDFYALYIWIQNLVSIFIRTPLTSIENSINALNDSSSLDKANLSLTYSTIIARKILRYLSNIFFPDLKLWKETVSLTTLPQQLFFSSSNIFKRLATWTVPAQADTCIFIESSNIQLNLSPTPISSTPLVPPPNSFSDWHLRRNQHEQHHCILWFSLSLTPISSLLTFRGLHLIQH